MKRLKELDFLRGVAIILILLRHRHISNYTTNMGWIGVDLFFVLSGFLISKLIIVEYLNFKSFNPKRFLIRRGFKIYPLYFLCYLVYLIPIIYSRSFQPFQFISDLFFIQNYTRGWGFAFGASWSLAVEEHFYFSVAFFSYFGVKYLKQKNVLSFKLLRNLIISLLTFCLILRFSSNLLFPFQNVRNSTMTHLRIDSLLAGVLISMFYHFRFEKLTIVFSKYKYLLLILFLIGISWTPFIDPINSFFIKTIGFTLLYLSFSILLFVFIMKENIVVLLNKILTHHLVNFVSKIGSSSYAIYIIHTLINDTVLKIYFDFNFSYNRYIIFFITSGLSITFGIIITSTVEKYFLNLRDLYFPKKI